MGARTRAYLLRRRGEKLFAAKHQRTVVRFRARESSADVEQCDIRLQQQRQQARVAAVVEYQKGVGGEHDEAKRLGNSRSPDAPR